MKKAVFWKCMIVLFVALSLSSAISCFMISRILMENTEEHMQYVLSFWDASLDMDKDLQEQVEALPQVVNNEKARFTIIGLDGTVYADSEVEDISRMYDHSDRIEVQEALEGENGVAVRKSDTLDISMLYVTHYSKNHQLILRVAIPFIGLGVYVKLLLPSILVSFIISTLVAISLAARFAKTVALPLKEISREIQKIQEASPKFDYKEYPYPELNIIAETTANMSKEIQSAIQKLEKEKTIRQEFFSNASHELKTPLTSVRGYIELMESGIVTDEAQKEEFFKRIKKETENMTHLINDILMVSRLETKEAEVVFSEVRMYPLLQDVLTSFETMAKNMNITIKIDCKPVCIYANLHQIQELLNNLIGNAIKYNHPGGMVKIKMEEYQKKLYISVADTGVGIPKESLDRIFERFYRVDKGRNKKIGGTGLGLSIVKHIVQFYNGEIQVKSVVGKGSVFEVWLPINRE
ncbi:Sensor histidine kinase YycG [Clostridiales bacterium CHKCI001]|nr:Sensor histidine kinase YycG [Clostridiales bacterium CHKCI001]